MPRLPFDPSQASGPPPDPPPARRERKRLAGVTDAAQLTVTQVADLIKDTLEQRLPSPLRVVGEVSNFSGRHHWYFSLKDETSVLSCVAWASSARRFGFVPGDGDEVVARGHVSHYAPQGRTQFYVDALEPVGAGALELRFRALCDELRVLGYFDPDHKKPLPPFPRRIAIVTSASGAAVHDVISTCAHRCAAVDLCIVDVRVQGTGAAEEVASAIRRLDAARDRLGLDAILVTRGGGSMEDLWAFNERVVADAVFRCTLPVVAAIGHESDTTIIELVADLRAATPTQAAMRLVPDAAELATQVEHLRSRLDLGLRRRVERARERVDRIARHGLFRDPGSRVVDAAARLERHRRMLRHIVVGRLAGERARLERLAGRMGAWRPQDVAVRRRAEVDAAAERLGRALVMHVRRLRERVTTDERQLQALNPQRVLSRGFSYTQRRDDGRLVRSVRDVGGGDVIVTRLHDGSVDSIVGGSEARRRPSRTPAPGDDQLDLFAGSE